MFLILFYTFLFSISPIGEARVGIPYAILNNVNLSVAFAISLFGNLLVYPLLMWLIDGVGEYLWKFPTARKVMVKMSKRAKKLVGKNIEKYGFWGLMIFVMIPLPGTGAYMGTIAAAVFKLDRVESFKAVSLGVFISCIIMVVGTYLSLKSISLF